MAPTKLTKAEFYAFLENLEDGFGDRYADILWDNDVRSQSMLASAHAKDLVDFGVGNIVHARRIIKGSGEKVLMTERLFRAPAALRQVR
jgi:hypothetical protein